MFRLICISFFLAVTNAWQNDFDKAYNVECPKGATFNNVQSVHGNYYEDRRWLWKCNDHTDFTVSYWKRKVNGLLKELFFTCRYGYALCGVYSKHDNSEEDRVFDFKCCSAGTKCQSLNIFPGGYVNALEGHLSYDTDRYIVGVQSIHDYYAEDRMWKFTDADITCGEVEEHPNARRLRRQ